MPMDEDLRGLFLHLLQAFAESENWSDDWVWQRVSLAATPEAIRQVSDSAGEVVLLGVAIWDERREFDYGDGEGSCEARRKLRAELRVSSRPASFPPKPANGARAGKEEFIGLYAGGQVEWRQREEMRAPHWLARQPMPVPEGLQEVLKARPSLWLRTSLE